MARGREDLEGRVEDLEAGLADLKDFLGKWLGRFYSDWVRLKHNAYINEKMTEEKWREELEAFTGILDKTNELREELEDLRGRVEALEG
jgi:polyhydroxyalkanoate synthesis regulator phasin